MDLVLNPGNGSSATRYGGGNPPPVNPRARMQPMVVTGMDNALVYITIALVAVGLVSVYTASAVQATYESGHSFSFLIKQIVAAVIGGIALIGISRLNFKVWHKLSYPIALLSIFLLILTMFVGTTSNGSERWIPLPFGIQFQPSDLAKLGAILLMAQATSSSRIWTPKLVFNGAAVAIMTGLIYQQPNLSVSMILSMVTAAMIYVGGVSGYIMVPTAFVGGYFVYQKILETPYQLKRIQGWLDPWKDSMDSGYNLIQSYFAISGGGLFGVGLGNSVQKLYYLPFQHTDFIYSVICEEWGFFGAVIVLGLFGLLAWRGFTVAWHCPNPFGRMLAFGITLAITLQAIINICVTTGLMPVTGVTLPLISYGGTSMVMTLSMIGILLNISRFRPNPRLAAAMEEDY